MGDAENKLCLCCLGSVSVSMLGISDVSGLVYSSLKFLGKELWRRGWESYMDVEKVRRV